MKRKCIQRVVMAVVAVAAVLAGVIFTPSGNDVSAVYEPDNTIVKIGLYYGADEMVAANLLNEIGSGYTFGYFDSNREFHPVGETDETAITMLKDWNMYLVGNKYYDEAPNSEYEVVGCYHVRLNIEFAAYEDAAIAAQEYSDAFPAYHNGAWYVCVGSYTSAADAEVALVERGIDGIAMTASSSCITVVATGTTRILFQFDYGTSASLAVMPRPDESGEKPQTWFRNYKYYGAFQYTRLTGGDITIVNVVDMEDYIKGVIPYEMNTLWPLEALKAQAICARTYAALRYDTHESYGFDLCRTVCCQTYLGTNAAGEGSDRAVEETAGEYITYDGELCSVFYFSSDGGATENCENVFTQPLPYLRGVYDPYEEYVDTGRKNWSFTYTAEEITNILQSKGYNCSRIVSITPTYTAMGNIYSLKFTDSNGKNWTFSKYNASSILYSSAYGKYTYSMRFTVKGEGQPDNTILYANSNRDVLEDIGAVYAVGGDGTVQKLADPDTISVLTGSGVEEISIIGSGATITADRYVISGSGWGHNVGMSQFGAKAMAEQGMNYKEILEFYFTGVTIG
ncbi:MAG: SpoIID/LytB domain-containing protein [Oscillospiraceae bacterium]|nr:SpoIID/LytB domain-containing protein [Oscillospiraceae bacterium]